MTDPFAWSLNLGRWSGTRVRISVWLILFAVYWLLGAMLAPKDHLVGVTAACLTLLMAALAVHELGHAAAALRFGFEVEEVRLWPLGSLVGPAPGFASRPVESFYVALAGPLASFGAAMVSAVALSFAGARLMLNPFGDPQAGGAPWIGDKAAAAFTAVWWLGWFGYLNWVLFLANLIPALPMDCGRMLRALLAGPIGGMSRESVVAPWTAHTSAAVLLLAGLIRVFSGKAGSGGTMLILLAFLIELVVRAEARMIEDGGFFDDGVFGYDFSEGYTSLEGSQAKVRPYRESALRRWQRRRSEQRRQRRRAREAAEEQRMDEILAKLHREGRTALTDEEHRFLVRVSAKYKNRSKSRD
ncbi:MAG TPA: site-2 protease family protein [Isosphaeraceae bacterium]|jgi:Zn-dependent protease|nr:site-2 protease family protein [Isosphaeraceae bacterium]